MKSSCAAELGLDPAAPPRLRHHQYLAAVALISHPGSAVAVGLS